MVYTIERTQKLPISLEQAWDFFSLPANLKKITPESMGFDIQSSSQFLGKIYAGQIICYIVRPVLGIPMFWMTEITQVVPGSYFIDEQRIGPYALWHHQHHFKAVPGGVDVIDLVHYRIPLGVLGRLAHWMFVKGQLESIFNYRWNILETMFGKINEKP